MTSPYFMLVFAFFLFGNRITRRKVLAAVLAFVGCVFIIGVVDSPGDMDVLGVAIGLLSGATLAAFTIGSKYVGERGCSENSAMFYFFLFSALLVLPLSDFGCISSVEQPVDTGLRPDHGRDVHPSAQLHHRICREKGGSGRGLHNHDFQPHRLHDLRRARLRRRVRSLGRAGNSARDGRHNDPGASGIRQKEIRQDCGPRSMPWRGLRREKETRNDGGCAHLLLGGRAPLRQGKGVPLPAIPLPLRLGFYIYRPFRAPWEG